MQCPNCNCELTEPTHCQNCDWKEEASAGTTTNAPESGDKQVVDDDSNVPPAPEAPPQAADSPDQPLESEPSPSPSPSPEKQPTASEQPTSQGNVKITEGSTVSARGNINVIGQLIAQMGKTEAEAKIEEVSLYDLTKKLPPHTVRYYPPRAELVSIVTRLKQHRLIFISCSFTEYVFDAAYEAIKALGIANPEQNRLIEYEDTNGKNVQFSVQKLLEQTPDVEGESVVLVDALNTGRAFPESILGHCVRADTIREDLRASKQFLVVIVDLNYAQNNNLRHQNFPYWEIPFLQPFLKENFPDQHEHLEAQIRGQREKGVWEKDEINFCQQIISFYQSDELLAVVEKGGPEDPEKLAEQLLKGSNPVEKTVLYAAAFFQEITPLEFSRVVEVLLTGRTIAAPAPTNGTQGSDAPVEAQTEVPLLRSWEEKKDDIFTNWLREMSVAKDSVRVVALSNPALREPLRKLFDRRHRFYVIDQFKALQERGIFFYPSIRLAENTTQIAVEMAGVYPDEFNEGWIVGLITRLWHYFESASSDAPDAEDSMFHFLHHAQPGAALHLALARVSDILRRMLELPQLKRIVQSCLEHLIKNSYHEATLLLVKQLQFTPEFDALHWFKQLLNRADNRTRRLTYYYLYSYLKRMGSGVYEGLKKIESWLPPAERAPASYSPFEYYVLQLLIQYCVETVARFNAKHYGEWPSRYPLLAIKDRETAVERISLLVRWLLHPGIETTLFGLKMSGTQMTLIGALLAEWTFILRGPRNTSPVDNSAPPEGSESKTDSVTEDVSQDEVSAAMLYDLLLQQFASRTNLTQRVELLGYWNRLNHDLLKFIRHLRRDSELLKELSWKRDLVSQLITQFKGAAISSKKSARPARITNADNSISLEPSNAG